MFDFWMHLKTVQTEEEANDPILHRRGQAGAPPRPVYDPESRELDPVALVEGFVEAGDVDGLLRMLEYHHPAVVDAAIDGLIELGTPVIPYMLNASRRAHLPLTVKLRVATALSEMAHDPDLRGPALRGLAGLLTHPITGVRRRALFLSVQHGGEAVPALVPILVSGSPRSRLEAGAALVEIGEPQGFGILAQVAHRLPVRIPRELSPALSTHTDRTGMEPMLGPYDAAHLREVITNPAAALEERRMAILRLAQSDGKAAARTIRGVLLNGEHDSLRSAAALALGYLGDAESVAALSEVAKSGPKHTSQTAALALELITGDVAFNTLLLALLHTEPATRRAAAYALGIGAGERAVPHLLPLLRDASKPVRQAAMVALRRIEAGSA